jgi:hypothetical protein
MFLGCIGYVAWKYTLKIAERQALLPRTGAQALEKV